MSDEKTIKQQLIVDFQDLGSAVFDVKVIGGIFPTQLLALAGWFELKGKEMLHQEELNRQYELAEQEKVKQQIVTPNKGKIAIGKIDEQSIPS